MIRIALVTDKNNIIGHSNLDDYFERASEWSDALVNQINKMFAGDCMLVGRTTLPLCLDYIPHYKDFYVLTSRPDQYRNENKDVTFTNDYQALIDTYRFSDEILTIGGGKSTWEIFLPYASELIICLTDEDSSGDIKFTDWQSMSTTLKKEVTWNGGKTLYYHVPQISVL